MEKFFFLSVTCQLLKKKTKYNSNNGRVINYRFWFSPTQRDKRSYASRHQLHLCTLNQWNWKCFSWKSWNLKSKSISLRKILYYDSRNTTKQLVLTRNVGVTKLRRFDNSKLSMWNFCHVINQVLQRIVLLTVSY